MTHFLSWTKLKRAVAWFLKLKHLLRELMDKKKKPEGERRASPLRKRLKGASLTFDDLVVAEKEIVKYYQKQSFKEELAALQKITGTDRTTIHGGVTRMQSSA